MADTLEHRAETIFEALLSIPTVDRPAAAAAACGRDAVLLARVGQLLGGLAAAGDGFLTDPTALTLDGSTPVAIAPIGERPGDRIGPYKLLEQIGEGGFGVVFMAEQERPVRRRVALKVIKLGMDTREVVARFEAERQALALMDHPNIARVFDAGSTATGRPYFVMELVRGSTITEYADGHKLTTRDRVALAAAVCRAVQHAHSKGVIHRDLKPTNVLVTTADDRPVVKVIDFGIAKATQGPLTDRTLFTAHRQLIGTPQYMSPEQADSNGVDVDTRTDVYSLGVVLYELLVGTTPMDARGLRSAAFEAMRKMIRDAEPAKPSTRLNTLGDTLATVAAARGTDAKQLGRQLGGELDWIVMRALEKDRSRRYDTAAALADDLNRYLSGDAVLAGPASAAYRLRKLARRYKAAVVVGGAIAACLLLGVAGTTFGLVRATANERRAVASEAAARLEKAAADASATEARRQQAIADAQRRDALAQKLVADEKSAEAKATLDFFTADVLAKASPMKTRDATVSKVLVDAVITPALKTVGQRFAGQPLVRASIQSTLANTLRDLGRPDLAEPQAKAAWDARRHSKLGDDHPATLEALTNYALAINAQGRYAEAERLDKQVWDARRRVQGDDHPFTLGALNNYALAINAQGRHAEAEPLLKQSWDACRRVQGDDHPDTLRALNNYALAIDAQGRHAEAERLFKQCWNARRRVQGDDHPDTLRALNGYASAIDAQGRHAEAERLFKQLWDARRRVQGADHPGTLGALNNYAGAINAQGRHAEAERLDKQLWDARRRVQGDDNPDTIRTKIQYEAARKAHELLAEPGPAATRPTGAAATTGPADAATLRARAEELMTAHRAADAEGLYRQAMALDRAAGPAGRADLAADLLGLARALPVHTRAADAIAAAEESADICRADRPAANFALLETDRKLGELLHGVGRFADSVSTYAEAVALDDATHRDWYYRSEDRMNLARSQQKAGDLPAAEATLRAALKERQDAPAAGGPTGKWTRAAARALAVVLEKQGKAAEAAAVRADAEIGPPTTGPATRP